SMCSCSTSGSYQVVVDGSFEPQGPREMLLMVCTATSRSRHVASSCCTPGALTRSRVSTALEGVRVALVAGDHVSVGEEHRVEGEALEAATVHRRDREPVARDADEAHEALIA